MYHECFARLHEELLYGDGPLPQHYRRFIAIMVSGDSSLGNGSVPLRRMVRFLCGEWFGSSTANVSVALRRMVLFGSAANFSMFLMDCNILSSQEVFECQ